MTFCCSWIKLFLDLIKSSAWKGWNYESFDKMIANMRVGICHVVTAESHSAHVILTLSFSQLTTFLNPSSPVPRVSWCWLVTPGNFVNWDENNLCPVLTDVTGVTLGHNNMVTHEQHMGHVSQSEQADGNIDKSEVRTQSWESQLWHCHLIHFTPDSINCSPRCKTQVFSV